MTDIELVDRYDFLTEGEQFIIVRFNEVEQCELKKKGNFVYTLKCQNGYEVYNYKDINSTGYRNLFPDEFALVMEFVREQIETEEELDRKFLENERSKP